MARIRTIKPEFFADEALSSCSPHARLLAIALLQLCDANGVFRNVPMQVHAHAFPWEATVNVPLLLGELEGIGYVKLYRVEGKSYGFVPGFKRHQRLSGKEAQSDGMHPGPDQADQALSDSDNRGSNGEAPERFPEKRRGAQEQGTGKGNRDSVDDGRACAREGEPDTAPPPAVPPDEAPAKPSALMAKELRLRDVDATSAHPTVIGWADEGITVELVVEAVEIARKAKPSPERIPVNYIDSILRNQRNAKPAVNGHGGNHEARPRRRKSAAAAVYSSSRGAFASD